jgi:elongation factor G
VEGRFADVPEAIMDAIQRGVEGSFASGIKMGYPCIDVGATLTEVGYDELTATEFAFEACAAACFDAACRSPAPSSSSRS